MKKWRLTASADGSEIDFETIIESDTEPSFWFCYITAGEHDCNFFTIEEA